MSLQAWLAFVTASLLIGLTPGPGVMSIVGYGIHSGRRVALASVAGMAAGNLIAMSLSLAGVGALLAASSTAFTLLKWIGAVYLIGIGLVTIARRRTSNSAGVTDRPSTTPLRAFAGNVLVGTFHPKTIMFFVAFVPQFIDPSRGYLAQVTLLVATFTLVVASSDTAYALLASRASTLLRTSTFEAWARRVGGGVMVAAGAATAAAKN